MKKWSIILGFVILILIMGYVLYYIQKSEQSPLTPIIHHLPTLNEKNIRWEIGVLSKKEEESPTLFFKKQSSSQKENNGFQKIQFSLCSQNPNAPDEVAQRLNKGDGRGNLKENPCGKIDWNFLF